MPGVPATYRRTCRVRRVVTRPFLYTDGGARGNPGPAGIGFVVFLGNEIVCEAGVFLGNTTNNVAEYQALIWGLENVAALGHSEVSVRADSELIVKQLTGVYRVKQPHLKPLAERASQLLRSFASWDIAHVRREKNKEADALVNAAIDARAPVGRPVCAHGAADAQGSLF